MPLKLTEEEALALKKIGIVGRTPLDAGRRIDLIEGPVSCRIRISPTSPDVEPWFKWPELLGADLDGSLNELMDKTGSTGLRMAAESVQNNIKQAAIQTNWCKPVGATLRQLNIAAYSMAHMNSLIRSSKLSSGKKKELYDLMGKITVHYINKIADLLRGGKCNCDGIIWADREAVKQPVIAQPAGPVA